MKKATAVVFAVGSAALLLASWRHSIPVSLTEAFGFVTGVLCVWLAVVENIWNWPIGIASSIFYTILFLHTRLYADMGLQVVYIVLGFLGWYWWLRGGENKSALRVTHAGIPTLVTLGLLVIAATYGMNGYLRLQHDSAPFWDALTTTLSLAGQYLITKKIIENWHIWFVTDSIYVGLYIYKHLYLTTGLYALYVVLCVSGLLAWRRSMTVHREPLGVAAQAIAQE